MTSCTNTAGLLLSVAISLTLSVKNAAAQFPPNPQSAAFTGGWCAQGDPAKQASIADSGGFLTLTNESGDTSPGQYQGQTGIVAPGRQFVTGTLRPDGSQINWSNGTFWARCNSGGGGGHHRLNLTGTWYAQGNRSQSCSIRQRGKNLQLSNESGDNAIGQMNGKRTLTANWNGNTSEERPATTASTGITEPTGGAFAFTLEGEACGIPHLGIEMCHPLIGGWGRAKSEFIPPLT